MFWLKRASSDTHDLKHHRPEELPHGLQMCCQNWLCHFIVIRWMLFLKTELPSLYRLSYEALGNVLSTTNRSLALHATKPHFQSTACSSCPGGGGETTTTKLSRLTFWRTVFSQCRQLGKTADCCEVSCLDIVRLGKTVRRKNIPRKYGACRWKRKYVKARKQLIQLTASTWGLVLQVDSALHIGY